VALGLLQAAGEIRRVPVNGRLDQQRYKYAAWKCKPSGSFTDLARAYFGWIGPAAVGEFQAFAGLGVKAAKAAVEPWDWWKSVRVCFCCRKIGKSF